MFLGTLLSGTGQIEKFSRKYLERMVYVIRYMQDMDGRKSIISVMNKEIYFYNRKDVY